MKKLILTLMAVFTVALFTTSCKNADPEIEFTLSLDGALANPAKNLVFDFAGFTSNTETLLFEESVEIGGEERVALELALEKHLRQNYVLATAEDTMYNIHVKGFVREVKSGITISVDKIFANTNELAIDPPVLKESPVPLDSTAVEV